MVVIIYISRENDETVSFNTSAIFALVALYMLIGWALDKHEWQKYKNLTKYEAQAEWESFLSDINDEEVNIADGGYVKVKFHEVFSMTNDENIRWYEGHIVGEKTWE